MAIDSALQFLGLSLEVFLIDLLLSGDNAVVIALACRRLPPPQRRQVMIIGTAVAIVLRIVLTMLASFLLRLPLLKLVGGIALAVIAIRLTLDEENEAQSEELAADPVGMISALQTVIVADLVMSTDNVMALAALTSGNVGVLAFGLAGSVPLLMFGSWFVGRLLAAYPVLIPVGGALLGWIAGDIAMSDPLYAHWIKQQSPFLAVAVPALTAVYVLAQTRIIRRQLPAAQVLRPKHVRRESPPPFPSQPDSASIPAPIQVATVLTGPIRTKLELAAEQMTLPVIAATARSSSAEAPRDISTWVSPFLVVGGVLSAVGALLGLLYLARPPQPAPMNQYGCAGSDFVILYAPGRSGIRISSGETRIDGRVLPSNQIEWGQVQAGPPLGTQLPTTIQYADSTRLGLRVPGAPGLSCTKR
jgi:YjbE family integral membrane protein